MIFNENWTKQDNDQLRKLNCDGKKYDEIVAIMGVKKLKYHPSNKYAPYISSVISNMRGYVGQPEWCILYDDVKYIINVEQNDLICKLSFTDVDLETLDNIDMFSDCMKGLLHAIKNWYSTIERKNVTFLVDSNICDLYKKLLVEGGLI